MDLILPYEDQVNDVGYFITPNGEFIKSPSQLIKCHEQIAIEYCEQFLNSEEKRLLDLWIKYYNSQSFSTAYAVTDFLTQVKGFDKATFKQQNAYMSTSSLIPHIRFYNYYLMGWILESINPQKYDEDTKQFVPIEYENLDIYRRRDEEAKEELDLLIKGTPLERRRLLFKSPN